MFYMIFDLAMAVIMLLFGIWFYRSEGSAAGFLSGYPMKANERQKKYDEKHMCMAYGKRMMFMSLPFIAGAVIDTVFCGIGCFIAWITWFALFLALLVERHQNERYTQDR